MNRIAKIILEKGCGLLTPAETFESKRFKELLKLFNRYNPEGDEKVALNTGHLVMGELLNTLPEQEAIKMAQSFSSEIERSPENRAMIQFLGELLVSAAEKCLTDEILELAKEWKQADVNKQIEIADKLYIIFRSEDQESDGDLNMETLRMSMERKVREVHDERAILPLLYGKWNGKNVANCQGKTQMLTAFARLAGARVMRVSPLTSCRDIMERARYSLRDLIIDDLKNRHLEDGDAQLNESIKAYVLEEYLGLRNSYSFHASTALELKDGRWILIDPHGLAWGIFPETYDPQSVFGILEKYRLALPGLNVIDHDHGVAKKVLEQRTKEAFSFIERSRKMEKEIQGKVENIFQLINFVTDNIDVYKKYLELEKIEVFADSNNLDYWQEIAVIITLGKNIFPSLSLMFDKEFLEVRIKSWLTLCHAIAMNILGNQLNDEAKIIHPVCEFSLPEYHIAIGCMNSISIDYHYIAGKFFTDHSFDQISLHNAGLIGNELGQAAIKTLRALPFVHSSCKKFL